jgi:hypothetical protein
MDSRDSKLFRGLAKIGAPLRLRQLQDEIEAIFRLFPELKKTVSPVARKTRKRRTMSAEARKKISAGMRATWQERKRLAS